MQNILILGAGRSATSLINYLIDQAANHDWHVIVADMSLALANSKIGNKANATAVEFIADDAQMREMLISQATVVISMLPMYLHSLVAKDCLRLGKSLFNASYVAKEFYDMEAELKEKGLVFLCELGLDPGIDHMSAMQIIDELKAQKAEIESFGSYTGGLVAPKDDNNPWHYKFSWNPRNVVVAGQNTAKYLENGKYKYVPYQRLFAEAQPIQVPGMGEYEIYPNRDSLAYTKIYGLEDVPSLLRATIRCKGYARAWNVFVQLGLTDDTYTIPNSEQLTYKEYFESFLAPHIYKANNYSIEATLMQLFNLQANDEIFNQMAWLEVYSDQRKVGKKEATPAQILLQLLEEKWVLLPEEKDLVIMQHEFIYKLNGKRYKRTSTLVQEGENAINTAMSSLVGLPLAIAVKHYLLGNIKVTGVQIPTTPDVYNPILKDLEALGVTFNELVEELA